MMTIEVLPLEGSYVRLEPLGPEHKDDLAKPASDERIWLNTPLGPSFDAYFEKAMELKASETQIPFAVRWKETGELIGGTRFMDIVREHNRLEIGSTWYHPDFWGGKVNPECKYLLLRHAFEQSDAIRVQLLTDMRNTHSQSAIAKLGAVREGIIRNHMIVTDGRLRDSVMFSIKREEWPAVKEGLEKRLAA